METSSTVRFLRSQILAGILWVMLLPLSEILVTVLWVHVIFGQSHGEDEEFQDWSDGGLPSCCLTSSRIDRSSSRFWEITWKGKEKTRRRNRAGNGILANKKVTFGIFVALSSFISMRRVEHAAMPGRFNFKMWWPVRIYFTEFYKMACVLGLITREPRVHHQWPRCVTKSHFLPLLSYFRFYLFILFYLVWVLHGVSQMA